jgi:hypothetical protein
VVAHLVRTVDLTPPTRPMEEEHTRARTSVRGLHVTASPLNVPFTTEEIHMTLRCMSLRSPRLLWLMRSVLKYITV